METRTSYYLGYVVDVSSEDIQDAVLHTYRFGMAQDVNPVDIKLQLVVAIDYFLRSHVSLLLGSYLEFRGKIIKLLTK